jgi:subtilisin family serine protease
MNSRTFKVRLTLAALALACVVPLALDAATRNAAAQSESHAPLAPRVTDELLVKFDKNSSTKNLRATHARLGARVVESFAPLGWQRVKLPTDSSVEEAIKIYEATPGVIMAQPNYVYRIDTTPNDTRYGELYGMTKIGAPAAWDLTKGSSAVVVAVIDTGIKYTHEDLAANIWTNPGETGTDAQGHDKATNGIDDDGDGFIDDVHGYDFDHNDPDPMDDNGHGTHCAGTIGAVGNNALGVAGVNWNVRLMAVKTHDSSGNSTSAKVVAAFNYVTMLKSRGVNVRVTSNSWGGAPEAAAFDQALLDALGAAAAADILNVFAAGNANTDTDAQAFYPAAYNVPDLISVAASDQNDNRASFSNYGATSVDLAAPGVSILSTYPSASNYATLSGTSMAAPHVAGAAALLAAREPTLTASALKASLLNNVDVLANWVSDPATGKRLTLTGGRLNVAHALQQPTACAYSLNQPGASFNSTGGNSTLNVNAQANCDWTARSNDSWITINSITQPSGNGSVSFSVAANDSAPRTGTINVAGQTYTVTQAAVPPTFSQVLISEFRIDGAAGAADEFYEIYNATSGAIVVSTPDNSAGWSLAAFVTSGGATFTRIVCTIPNGATIPAHGHYLCANNFADANNVQRGYSLADYGGTNRAAPDQATTGAGLSADGVNVVFVGLALSRSSLSFTTADRLDAVGTSAPAFGFTGEGQPVNYRGEYNTAAQYSWVRKIRDGAVVNTNDNASDFVLVSTTGGVLGGVQSTLGAPSPQNSSAPVERGVALPSSLLDPKCAGDIFAKIGCQNSARNFTDTGVNRTFGTLAIRRRFRNLTGAPLTRVRFRVTEITTLNSAPAAQGADLRVLSSPDLIVTTRDGRQLALRGATLEEPPAQTFGGGLNSSLTLDLSATPLAPGDAVDVQFLLGIEREGKYRFVVQIELP